MAESLTAVRFELNIKYRRVHCMDKKDVIVIHTKKDKTATRGYLLLRKTTNFEQFVVCSNFRELEDGTVTWDWGHYLSNIVQALIVMYESELGMSHKESYEIINQLQNKIASDDAVAVIERLNELIA